MKLYIAEKPSLARAIANVLPKPQQKGNGYIKAANGDVVSWCIGHLLEQAPPDFYDARFKKWQLNDLPIIPEKWLLLPKPTTHKQLRILTKLMHEADVIIHAGDPDREGQLLIDEILNYAKLPIEKIHQAKRCLISDLNAHAVQKALDQLKLNQDFVPLSISALARARADWLYGINMSRLYTLKGRSVNSSSVLSVGRVQTPLLGLVTRRDAEIADFVPKPFYEVYAILETQDKGTFQAKWQPSEACAPYQDEEGRVLVKALAENVVERIQNQTGTVVKVVRKEKTWAPPLPLNLSSLQIEMAKKKGLSAKTVLECCQNLYEKHKLITYPRSDCRYLPEDHLHDKGSVCAAMAKNVPTLEQVIDKADPKLRSKAWNSAKVDAHHAIIPTLRHIQFNRLTETEQVIYHCIALHYIAQFYPMHRYNDEQIDVILSGGLFIAKKIRTLEEGWKVLFKSPAEPAESEPADSIPFFPLKKGDTVLCINTILLNKETQPPKPFSDATLLSAMTGIARFVKDPNIKKILRETDGLGTEATRAGIIELLFRRQFLVRQGKQIHATAVGKQLIANLPDIATTPDLTAVWEQKLDAISKKKGNYTVFIQELEEFLHHLMHELSQKSFR